MNENILLDSEGGIATITLNRPEKLNALTRPMWQRLGEVIDELSSDKSLRCIVLRGAGGKAFSPGNDIGEFETERANSVRAKVYGEVIKRTLSLLIDCPIPTVALIEGICVGGGMVISGCCDFRICGPAARFGAPIKSLGITMSHDELAALLRFVGPSIAKEILIEGRKSVV